MLEWSRRGPRHADVEDLTVEWEEPRGEAAFEIR
jgi:hypothetical protein